jgi:hypothetical protein
MHQQGLCSIKERYSCASKRRDDGHGTPKTAPSVDKPFRAGAGAKHKSSLMPPSVDAKIREAGPFASMRQIDRQLGSSWSKHRGVVP